MKNEKKKERRKRNGKIFFALKTFKIWCGRCTVNNPKQDDKDCGGYVLITKYWHDVLWEHQEGFLTHPAIDRDLFPELKELGK